MSTHAFTLMTDEQLQDVVKLWKHHSILEVAMALEIIEYRNTVGPLSCKFLTIEDGNVGPKDN